VGTNRFAVLVTVFAALLNRLFLAMRYNAVRKLKFQTRICRGARIARGQSAELMTRVEHLEFVDWEK
jgi:hypothetical protein